MAAAGLPRASRRVIKKRALLTHLTEIDADNTSRERVLRLETEFRKRIQGHVESLPLENAAFVKFNTSPFVLLIHTFYRGYATISEIEADILPAKLFSSMETSAGRMVEAVMLAEYGWECVESAMHTANSALDGKCLDGDVLKVATLKSGPRCLNDEMSENFADAIITNITTWASDSGVERVHFTYGVLYGTQTLSNKKDWHILRNIREKLPDSEVTRQPDDRWDCAFSKDGVDAEVTIRIGEDWWTYLGGAGCLTEMLVALIRACVQPGRVDSPDYRYTISDLGQIVSVAVVPENFNVGILQQSQLPWLFFMARHFCDEFSES